MARTPEEIVETGIVQEDFSVIMAQAFATYGLSVVTDRALPDARDGLKPVQRRILAGMRPGPLSPQSSNRQERRDRGTDSQVTIIRTATLLSMTQLCVWPSPSRCAIHSSKGRATWEVRMVMLLPPIVIPRCVSHH